MSEKINIDEAAKWLARMASIDGEITPNERRVLKEFAETYGADVNYLYRLAHAKAKEVSLPEVVPQSPSEAKGRLFEEFIVGLCCDKSRIRILAWRSDKIAHGVYAAENCMPDLHLQHRLDEQTVEYLVECKYRSSWGDKGIDLSDCFARYHHSAKDAGLQLFIALGVGGSSSNPDDFLIVPDSMVRFDKIIDRHRFSKCHCNKTPEAYHNYIQQYFCNRIFKKTIKLR